MYGPIEEKADMFIFMMFPMVLIISASCRIRNLSCRSNSFVPGSIGGLHELST